jgi:RNA polymerase sigma-70 factor, ECF subfamily
LSLAFLVLLEELQPVERAAFLLHDVFDYPYDEIAGIIDRTETACRQLVSRARRRVDARRRRFDVDRAHGLELTRRFLVACGTGDLDGLLSLLSDDVVVWTDGGGKAQAALRPVGGPHRASRFLLSVARKVSVGVTSREVDLNGQPGLVFEEEGRVTMALTLDVLGDRVVAVRVMMNPDKLVALQPRPGGDLSFQ